jgi:hypothetical protein
MTGGNRLGLHFAASEDAGTQSDVARKIDSMDNAIEYVA